MLIVIYRSEYYQMMELYKDIKRELMKRLDPYTLICSGTKMYVGPDIRIDFRCEFIGNMTGLNPNYYNAVGGDSYTFLSQAAAKVNGKHVTIPEILDIIKDYIEDHRVKEKEDKILVGDLATGYRYVDTDTYQIALESLKAVQTKDIMNKHFGIEIRKEDHMPTKMNYRDLYINGNLFGGLSAKKPTVKDIEILGGVTTLVWSDGDVTIVTCGPDDEFDTEKAIAMAIAKKFIGTNKSKSNYIEEIRRLEQRADEKYAKRKEKEMKKELKKAVKKDLKKYEDFDDFMNPPVEADFVQLTIKEYAIMEGKSVDSIRKQCAAGKIPGAEKIAGKWYIPVIK